MTRSHAWAGDDPPVLPAVAGLDPPATQPIDDQGWVDAQRPTGGPDAGDDAAISSTAPTLTPARLPMPRQPAARPAPPGTGTTLVLPYIGSPASRRTRRLRAWMLVAPIDLLSLLVPRAYSIHYWRGTIVAAGLATVFFAVGGHYRPRRHLSFLDELPSLCGRLLAAIAIVAIIACETP